jgi:branched-chain amino acid transport system permease protein
MDSSIFGILALDGLTNGAVYALLALATVLVFAVTRAIFIPQGEFVAFGALTLALFQSGRLPGTVWLLLILAAAVVASDLLHGLRQRQPAALLLRGALRTLALPVALSLLAWWAAPRGLPIVVQALLSLALVTALGPLLYRLAYEALAEASVLVLLIVPVGCTALTGWACCSLAPKAFATHPSGTNASRSARWPSQGRR